MTLAKKTFLSASFVIAFAASTLIGTASSHAAGYSIVSGYGGTSITVYRGSSVYGSSFHYDRVYRPTSVHWTPSRGVHTHGYIDCVPHATTYPLGHPQLIHGHDDHFRGGHIDPGYHFYH